MFVLPSTGFELTPSIYIYMNMLIYVFIANQITANLKKNAPSGGRGVRPPLHVIYNLRMITLFQHKDDKLELLPV